MLNILKYIKFLSLFIKKNIINKSYANILFYKLIIAK